MVGVEVTQATRCRFLKTNPQTAARPVIVSEQSRRIIL